MSATIVSLNPHGLARISALPVGFRIALRSRRVSVDYSRPTADDAAELAIILRDEGDWKLHFGSGADEVRSIVTEIDREGVQ